MSSPLRTVWQQGRIYGLGNILNRVAGLLLIPILLHSLSAEAWGAYALILVVSQVILTVPAAFIDAMLRLYFDEGEIGGDRAITATLVLYVVIALLLAGLAYPMAWVIGELVFEHQDYQLAILLANIALIFEFLWEIELGYLRMRLAANIFVIAALIRSLVQFVLCIYLVVFAGMAVTGLMLGHLLAVVVVALPIAFYMLRRIELRISRLALAELLRIGLPLLPANLGKDLLDLVGRVALNILATTSAVGIFAVAAKLADQLHVLLGGPFANVWSVQLLEVSRQPEKAEEINRVMVYFVFVLATFVLGLSLFGPEVVMLLSAREYWSAAAILPILAFGAIVRIFYQHFETCILQSKQTWSLPVLNWVSVGVAVAAFYLLIPRFGLMGAAAADVLSRAFRVALCAGFAVRLSDYARFFPWGRSLGLFLLAAAFYLIGLELVGQSVSIAGFLMKSVLVALFVACAYFGPALTKEERRQIALWAVQTGRRLRG